MPYGKILVAYDDSDHSKEAVRLALELAERELAQEVHVLEVMEPYVAEIPYAGTEVVPEQIILSEITDESREDFKSKILDLAKNSGVVPSTEIRLGTPKDTILKVAKEQGAGLIVMGSRGLGPLRGLLGSVSYSVLSHSEVPVLIIR